jgi:hypothetical protein
MHRMEGLGWITGNWVDLLQSVGIVGGLLFSAHTIRKESRARQIGNMLAAAQHHHSIWKEFYTSPHLARVTNRELELGECPITEAERMFVTAIIIHLDSLHRAIKARMFLQQEGLRRDVKDFFSLPIPRAVWEDAKLMQDRDFVAFVESCRKGM